MKYVFLNFHSGENVEEAFLETAKKIYQNIQDGRWLIVDYFEFYFLILSLF